MGRTQCPNIFLIRRMEVYSKSDGSHSSGMDINCAMGRISNKSSKYSKNKQNIDISSYRLTTVCSENKCGEPEAIITEINRRKNFDYYSVIIRDETSKGDTIKYDWLLIPSSYGVLDPSSYTWSPIMGKNKDKQVGWHTNELNGSKMAITFSMSSQLWIHINMTEDIKKFIIASAEVSTKPSYNYIQIGDMLS